jgi:hypothetical protein
MRSTSSPARRSRRCCARRRTDSVTVYRYRASGRVMKALQRLDKHRLWWTRNPLENGWPAQRIRIGLEAHHQPLIQ